MKDFKRVCLYNVKLNISLYFLRKKLLELIVIIPEKEIEDYLMVQARKIRNTFSDSLDAVALYEEYYADVENNHLRAIFPLLHAKLNGLFEFLNHKLSPGYRGHYNADQSRDLLDVINTILLLQANLKNTSVGFQLDPYYSDLVGRCRTFLSKRLNRVCQ